MNNLQRYINNLNPDIRCNLDKTTLYLFLAGHFIVEIDMKTDEMKTYTLGKMYITESDIELLNEIKQNSGIIQSYASEKM